jgi:hypothetical protein
MTTEELKKLITDWALARSHTDDCSVSWDERRVAIAQGQEAIELIELQGRGEIDMTDEMIDAGLAALYSPHARFRDGECLVAAIFEAMIGASPSRPAYPRLRPVWRPPGIRALRATLRLQKLAAEKGLLYGTTISAAQIKGDRPFIDLVPIRGVELKINHLPRRV